MAIKVTGSTDMSPEQWEEKERNDPDVRRFLAEMEFKPGEEEKIVDEGYEQPAPLPPVEKDEAADLPLTETEDEIDEKTDEPA